MKKVLAKIFGGTIIENKNGLKLETTYPGISANIQTGYLKLHDQNGMIRVASFCMNGLQEYHTVEDKFNKNEYSSFIM